jgi:hypothetical protein
MKAPKSIAEQYVDGHREKNLQHCVENENLLRKQNSTNY